LTSTNAVRTPFTSPSVSCWSSQFLEKFRRVHRLVPGEGRFVISGSTTPRAVVRTGDELARTRPASEVMAPRPRRPTLPTAGGSTVETRLRRDEAAVSETENQRRNVLEEVLRLGAGFKEGERAWVPGCVVGAGAAPGALGSR
jgi:hypothetical protein